MKCADCRYEALPECRRYPPSRQGWPLVEAYHWCGEWRSKDAIKERKVEENGISEYQGTDGIRPATETSGGYSNAESWKEEEKVDAILEKAKRGWPKGKPRK